MAGTIARRVFVEDERRNGSFLRMTWHPERRAFVVSNWEGSVCVGATRVPVEGASSLIAVLADGLTEAAAPTSPLPRQRLTLAQHLRTWWHDRTAHAAISHLRDKRRPTNRAA
jgi:hypothetical protein